MATKFFYCKHCGNVVVKIVDSGVTPVCCGEEMVELVANTFEGLGEKHLPAVKRTGKGTYEVQVGSILHPMLKEHSICFIFLETEKGFHVRKLEPGDRPIAFFNVCEDKPVAVYEYCNVHGLWKTEFECDKKEKC